MLKYFNSLYNKFYERRMIVSARHKGEPLGLLEYNRNGECIGRMTSHLDSLKTVVHIVSGFTHVLLCSSSGLIGRIRLRRSSGLWTSPTIINLHSFAVLHSASTHRSGVDLFFTSDKYCNIGVIIIENDRILKSVLNPAFVHATISAISIYANYLYIGQVNGVLLVIDISDLLYGDFKTANTLKDNIIFYGDVFDNKTAVFSLGVISTHSFFSLPNQDPPPGRKSREANAANSSLTASVKVSESVKTSSYSSILNSALFGGSEGIAETKADSVLEGHLLL